MDTWYLPGILGANGTLPDRSAKLYERGVPLPVILLEISSVVPSVS